MSTPRTDAAALGFARLLVDHGTPGNPKFDVTEIIPADFARQLETEAERLREALTLLADDNQDLSAEDMRDYARAAMEPK